MFMKRTKIKLLLNSEETGQKVNVKGWVRTKRESKNVIFIALNDGSTINNLQIVVSPGNISEELLKPIATSARLR